MGSIPSELRLDCSPVFVPRTIKDFLGEISMIGNLSERVLRIDDYVTRLEDEMRKIDAFKRELPLCMLLVNDAIGALKEESVQCKKSKVETPVLEEFIPLKKSSGGDGDGSDKVEARKDKDSREKMNWMSSVQLWHGENHPNSEFVSNKHVPEADLRMRNEEAENSSITNDLLAPCRTRNIGKAFMPFKRYSGFGMKDDRKDLPGIPGLSLRTTAFKNPRDDIIIGCLNTKACGSRPVSSTSSSSVHSIPTGLQPQQQQHSSRKQRRCWSPELHKRFVDALHQLGGAQVATPKQIRELMQVDGLTNDEVKSHLQKYRLHTRRVPGSQASCANQSVLVLGNLFMPHESKSIPQSGSPQSPLHQGDSMDDDTDD